MKKFWVGTLVVVVLGAVLVLSPVPGLFLWGKTRRLCVQEVKTQLTSPYSARFPGISDWQNALPTLSYGFGAFGIGGNGGSSFEWNSYVDSENGFGAMGRSQFECGVSFGDRVLTRVEVY